MKKENMFVGKEHLAQILNIISIILMQQDRVQDIVNHSVIPDIFKLHNQLLLSLKEMLMFVLRILKKVLVNNSEMLIVQY